MVAGEDHLVRLREGIAARSARIAVVGLGYVGIPVAASFAAAGFAVVGIDPDPDRVRRLNAGELPLGTTEPGLGPLLNAALASERFRATQDPAALAAADIAVVAVDTPLGAKRQPDLTQLRSACATIADLLPDDRMVVVESTLAPGTMRRDVAEAFTKRGRSIHLVHCPERVRPGRLLRNLRGMARLVGSPDPSIGALALELYKTIVEAELIVTDWETAEVVKVAENTTRDVQIALANQLAVICDHAGVDFRQVRDHVNGLWRSEPLILEAGAGVGGHCLTKDPWLMISGLPDGTLTALVEAAREVNDGMTLHTLAIVERALRDSGLEIADATLAVLGSTYDADADDVRNAPGPRLSALLRERGALVVEHDPYLGDRRALADALTGVDAAILVIPHTAFVEGDWVQAGKAMRRRIVVDCRRRLQADALRSLGFSYYALGVGALR